MRPRPWWVARTVTSAMRSARDAGGPAGVERGLERGQGGDRHVRAQRGVGRGLEVVDRVQGASLVLPGRRDRRELAGRGERSAGTRCTEPSSRTGSAGPGPRRCTGRETLGTACSLLRLTARCAVDDRTSTHRPPERADSSAAAMISTDRTPATASERDRGPPSDGVDEVVDHVRVHVGPVGPPLGTAARRSPPPGG